MTNIKYEVFLDQFFSRKDADIWSENTSLFLLRPLIKLELLLNKLKKIPGVRIFNKHDIPLEWNYKRNLRIGQVVIVANEGVALVYKKNLENKKVIEFFNRKAEKAK